jgi:hypothetical protein
MTLTKYLIISLMIHDYMQHITGRKVLEHELKKKYRRQLIQTLIKEDGHERFSFLPGGASYKSKATS